MGSKKAVSTLTATKSKSDPLEEQSVLFTAESSLQPLVFKTESQTFNLPVKTQEPDVKVKACQLRKAENAPS